MKDIILVAVILVIVGCAARYIYKAKKRGETCIGCPCSKQCGSSSCSCGTSQDPDAK